MSDICGWKQSSKHDGWFVFSLFQKEEGKQIFFHYNHQNIYTWCSWLRQCRPSDQHAVTRIVFQIECAHPHAGGSQTMLEVQWGWKLLANNTQEPVAHLSGDLIRQQKLREVLLKTQIWLRGNSSEALRNRDVRVEEDETSENSYELRFGFFCRLTTWSCSFEVLAQLLRAAERFGLALCSMLHVWTWQHLWQIRF